MGADNLLTREAGRLRLTNRACAGSHSQAWHGPLTVIVGKSDFREDNARGCLIRRSIAFACWGPGTRGTCMFLLAYVQTVVHQIAIRHNILQTPAAAQRHLKTRAFRGVVLQGARQNSCR
jgi:hypothetical protein